MADPVRQARNWLYRERRKDGDRVIPVRLRPDDFATLQLLGYLRDRHPITPTAALALEAYFADQLGAICVTRYAQPP